MIYALLPFSGLTEMLGTRGIRGSNAPEPLATVPASAGPVLQRILEIPGTQKAAKGYEFLKSWGIAVGEVQDVSVIAGPASMEDIPESVKQCLAMCFRAGNIRGVEASQVVAGRALAAGQTLYFVLTESKTGIPQLTALVG